MVGIEQALDSRVTGCQGVSRGAAGKLLIALEIYFKIDCTLKPANLQTGGVGPFSAWIPILTSEGGAAESYALAGADSGALPWY
jgi:hypothetical protein